jgi:hypothetical protein
MRRVEAKPPILRIGDDVMWHAGSDVIVTPAKAGVHVPLILLWIPTFAGMTWSDAIG